MGGTNFAVSLVWGRASDRTADLVVSVFMHAPYNAGLPVVSDPVRIGVV